MAADAEFGGEQQAMEVDLGPGGYQGDTRGVPGGYQGDTRGHRGIPGDTRGYQVDAGVVHAVPGETGVVPADAEIVPVDEVEGILRPHSTKDLRVSPPLRIPIERPAIPVGIPRWWSALLL